jgi:hypothetical protein
MNCLDKIFPELELITQIITEKKIAKCPKKCWCWFKDEDKYDCELKE